jgi:hypothetical protein
MSQTIVISAGRNVLTEPMNSIEWNLFHGNIEQTLDAAHALYYTKRALGAGQYQGQGEESVTYVVEIHEQYLSDIERGLAKLAGLFNQESIALMVVHQTIFCG